MIKLLSKILQRILCVFGFHQWVYLWDLGKRGFDRIEGSYYHAACISCKVKGFTEDRTRSTKTFTLKQIKRMSTKVRLEQEEKEQRLKLAEEIVNKVDLRELYIE